MSPPELAAAAIPPARTPSTQPSSAAGAPSVPSAAASADLQISPAPATSSASLAALTAAPARSRFSIGMLTAAGQSVSDSQPPASLLCATPTAPDVCHSGGDEERMPEEAPETLNQSSSSSTSSHSSSCSGNIHSSDMPVAGQAAEQGSSIAEPPRTQQDVTEAATPGPGSRSSSYGGAGTGGRARAQQLVQPEWLALQKAALAEMQQAFKAYGLGGSAGQQEAKISTLPQQPPAAAAEAVLQQAVTAECGTGQQEPESPWKPIEPAVDLLRERLAETAVGTGSGTRRHTPTQPTMQRVKGFMPKQAQQQAAVAAARQRRMAERQAYGQQQALEAQQEAAKRAARAAGLEAARKDKMVKAGCEKQEVSNGAVQVQVVHVFLHGVVLKGSAQVSTLHTLPNS